MSVYQVIILAIIEGLTEYIPVSSTGHMIIAESFMGLNHDNFTKLFTIAIQIGALMAIVFLYYKNFLQNLSFYYKLIVGVIPAIIFGFLFNDIIDTLLESVVGVAISLIIGGIFLLFVDDWFKENKEEEITYLTALKIGFFQCIALIPGVSRSGASIVGGLFTGLTRASAAQFSFFLAIPTLSAATLKKMLDFYKAGEILNNQQINLLLLGNIISFFVALFAVKSFITFLNEKGFKWFGIYRIVLGISILIIHFAILKLTIN